MPLEIATYVDPGVYIGEVIVPGAVNIATTPLLVGIVAPGSRQKRVTNEPVQRGLVTAGGLSFHAPSGTGAPGTDSISAPVGGIQTLSITGAAFLTQVIGSTVTIRNDPNPSNNGTFLITDRPSGSSISYSNPSGVANAAFAGTYEVKPTAIVGGLATPVRTNRRLQNTTVYRDARALSDSFLNFRKAHVESAVPGPVDLTVGATITTPAIVLEMDGKVPLTIIFVAGAGATTVSGTEVRTRNNTIPALATASIAQIAAAINEALNPADVTANAAVTALGYGAAYAGSASVITAVGIRIASPTTGPSSDVRISTPIASSVVTQVFGAAGAVNRDAPSVVEMERVVYSTTSVYTIDYININDTSDALANANILSVARIGTDPGIGTFTESTDFALSSDQIDWSLGTYATFISTVAATFDLTTHDTIRLSIDGKPAIDIDLINGAATQLGYVTGGSPTATRTAADVAANINAVLAANANYGSRYQAVASAVTIGASIFVQLRSPTLGDAGSITISTPSTAPANDANQRIFGLQTTQLPHTVVGTGREPSSAAIYFVTYDITRPSADYNVQKRFFSESQAQADLGTANASNPLMIAVKIAFRQGVRSLVVVQVNDSSLPGSPTRQEFVSALDATTNSDLITEVCVLSTDLATQIDLKDHIERESSPTRKHYRRGYWGMNRNTDPGDKDTPDTFVYRAQRTLQVSPESPGRGRMILVAPPQRSGVSIDLQQTDGSTERVNLDSTYLSVAIAAKKASFTSPALSLASTTIGGFNVDDIDLGAIWKPEERGVMASQGTMVVTYDGGNFKILDPCTTEQGAGGLPQFTYPSASSQKDNVTRKVDRALTANIVGVVPSDLSDFIVDIKVYIGEVIKGEIGSKALAPYINADRSPRQIDLTKDIEVEQSQNDPTKFFFKYFFRIRYPALRLLGEFSVDNPFFTTTAQAAG